MNCRVVAWSVALCLAVGCTSTATDEHDTAMDTELTAIGLDSVGLEEEGKTYRWYSYKSTLPFAGEAKESTAVLPLRNSLVSKSASSSKRTSQARSTKRSR